MDRRAEYEVVAEAVKVQYQESGDKLFLVFEITDENFKQKIRDDWTEDIELEVIKRKLVKFKR